MKETPLIFVVEDDPVYRKLIELHLRKNKEREVLAFGNAEDCLMQLERKPDVIVLDYYLESSSREGSMTGMLLIEKIKEKDSGTKVIVLSGQDKMEIAVDCIRMGAFDYIVKSESAFVKLDHIISMALYVKKMEVNNPSVLIGR